MGKLIQLIFYVISLVMFALNHFLWKNDSDVLFWGILIILNYISLIREVE
jgi:hypothetical protein